MQNATAAQIIERLKTPIRSLNPLHLAHAFQREVFFVATLGLAAFYYTALISFSPLDPSLVAVSLPEYAVSNLGGKLGADLSGAVYFWFGAIAWLLPLPFLMGATLVLKKNATAFSRGRLFGWTTSFICLMTVADLKAPLMSIKGFDLPAGGAFGSRIASPVFSSLGKVGAMIALITLVFCSILLIFRKSLITSTFEEWRERRKQAKTSSSSTGAEPKKPWIKLWRRDETKPMAQPLNETLPAWASVHDEAALFETLDKVAPYKEPQATPMPPFIAADHSDYGQDEPSLLVANTAFKQSQNLSPYTPPPVSLFQSRDAAAMAAAVNPKEIEATAQMLVKTFEDFGVQGKVIGYQPGPVVTVYEYQPEAGIKQSKVLGLIDDLALALKVDSIFIHPVQGKRALGVQVPNSRREAVFLGDIINTPAFCDAPSPLTFAMGKTINGHPMCADLTAMPHLLVAGATGSGKSVAINTMLCSIIMKAKPQDVRMILVDPKMLELSVYEGIPHLLMPVITEPTKASMALKWAANEMEQRYRLMQHACVRNIQGFNEFWEKSSEERRQQVCDLAGFQHSGRLPYIVLVIDELADLMMTAPKDVEASIQRLAQKARASGIHMVLATQRPSVDIITGVIKANLPCRVAFQVVSKHDSRTILDLIGAEKLLGRGDMLLQRPGIGRLERLQGALITDEEVLNLVAAIKVDGKTHYDQTIMSWIDEELARQTAGKDEAGNANVSMDDDPKWDEAINIARTHGVVSASFLQRHMKIGYNRAARIVEFMEAQGLVDKADGAKPRKWLGSIG